MSRFPTIKIAELIESKEAKLQTGPFGTQLKASDYVDDGVPVINVRNVGFGDIRKDNLEYLDARMVEKLAVHVLQKGDIVFGRKGAVERHAYIHGVGEGWIQGSDCLRLRITSKRINNKFISHYFKTAAHQDWMQALCSFGATMASLNQDIVKLINIPLPHKDVQDTIAAILTTYDDLIENNKRRIAILEKMAEEIYREWFVRFRFPGYQTAEFDKGIPKGWENDKADKFFEHVKGKSYGSDEILDFTEDAMPFITLKSFNRGGGYRSNGLKSYSGKYNDRQVVFEGDVVMAVTDMTQNREVVGRVARVPDLGEKGAVISLDVIKLVPKTVSATYLYSYLKYSGFGDFIKSFANGANVLHLKPDLVTQQKIVVPTKELRLKFEALVTPIHEQVGILSKEISNLELTRNNLLPRLISGKLSVENLDIKFPPSMQNEINNKDVA